MYLDLEWKGRFLVFTVLPFGLCTACYVFTKLLCPLVRYRRSLDLKLLYTLMMACVQRMVRGRHVRQVSWSAALSTKHDLQLDDLQLRLND